MDIHERVRSDALATESAFVPSGSVTTLKTRLENVAGYRPVGMAKFPLEAANMSLESLAFQTARRPGLRESTASSGLRDAALLAFRKTRFEAVIGTDDRVAIADTRATPFCRIAALRIKPRNGPMLAGTGWFIGPRTVVTAGHCVYLHESGGWPTQIEVIPALNQTDRPFGNAIGTRFATSRGWQDGKRTDGDYGVVFLDEDTPLGNTVGAWAFGALPEDLLQTATVNIAGYPTDRDSATSCYFHGRLITGVDPTRLLYEVDTFGGQSGSPVWITVGEKRVVVGVHTLGASSGNTGVRIISPIYQNLRHWKENPDH